MTDIVYGVVLKARKDGSFESATGAVRKEIQGIGNDAKLSTADLDALTKGFIAKADTAATSVKKVGDAGTEAGKRTKENFSAAEQAVNKTSKALDQAKVLLLAYFSVQTAISGARAWLATADEITLVNARLKQVTTTQKELKEVQETLYSAAQRLGGSYGDLAQATSRMAPAIRELGGGAREAARLAEIVVATAKIQGSTTQEATAAAIQFAQALGSGVLAGDELKSILENNQKLARVLAEGLGVSSTALKKMGEEGKLTSDLVATAVLKGYDKIRAEAANIPATFEQGYQRMKNASAQAVNSLNQQYQVTNILGGAMSALAGGLDLQTAAQKASGTSTSEARNAMAVLAITAASVIDLLGALVDIMGVTSQASVTMAYGLLGSAAALRGDGLAAIEYGKAAAESFKATGQAASDMAYKWSTQTTLAAQTGLALSGVGTAVDVVGGKMATLSTNLDKANAGWREVTKGINTVSSAQADYKEDVAKLDAAYVKVQAAAIGQYKTDAAMTAARTNLAKEYADNRTALDRRLQESKDAIAKKDQVSFEKAIKNDQLRADSAIRTAELIFSQTKLAIDERLNYEEFARKMGLSSEVEYIARKGALKLEESDADIARIRKNISAEAALLAATQVKATKAIGKEEKQTSADAVVAQQNKVIEQENKLTVAIQARGNAQAAVDRDGIISSEAYRRVLTDITSASEEYIKGVERENEDIQFQISLLGKSEAEVRKLTVARTNDLRIQQLGLQVMKDLQAAAGNTAQQEAIAAAYANQVTALVAQKDTLPQLQGNLANVSREAQALTEAWRQFDDAGFEAFKSIITGSGSALDSLKKLGNYLKNELLRWLYQMTAQKFAIQVFGSMTGSAGQAIAGNMATSASGNLFSSLLGNTGSGAIGASLFGSAGAYAAAVPGLTATGVGSQAAMLAAQTAEFGASGLASTAAAGGSSLAGGLAALGPYAAAAIAIYAIYTALKKPGGPKTGGGVISEYSGTGQLLNSGDGGGLFGVSQQNGQFAQVGKGMAEQFFASLQAMGGKVGNVKFSLGSDQDPAGTAENRIKNFVDVNGQRVYSVMDKGVGRDAERLQTELDLEAKRAIVAALKASDLPENIAKIFSDVDIAGASLETLNGLIDLGSVIKGLGDSGLKLTIDQLRAMQQSGETLSQTLARVVSEHGNLIAALANVGAAIQQIKSDAYDFNKSIGQRILSVGGSFNMTGLASGRLGELRGDIGGMTDPSKRMAGIQSYVGVVDDYLSARRAEIEAAGQAAQANAQAQMDMQRAINEARVSAIQFELDIAKQWADVLNRAQGALKSMQLSTLNPATATVRYQMAKDMVQAARQAYEANASTGNATKYLEALQTQSGMFSSVFQRPSDAQQAEYNDVATQISALAGASETQASKAEGLQQQLLSAQQATAASSAASAAGIGDVSGQMAALNTETAGLYTWAQEQYNLAAGEQLNAAYTQQELLDLQLKEMFTQTDLLTQIRDGTGAGTGSGNGIVVNPVGGGNTGGGGAGGGGGPNETLQPITLNVDGVGLSRFVLRTIVDNGQVVKQTVDQF